MNLATLNFQSAILRRPVTYHAILPDPALGHAGPYPVVLQLHGYTDDHNAWLTFSNLVRHAKPYPMIILLPDGATSWYLNLTPQQRYEDFLLQDLPAHVNATFQVRPGPWGIGGLSMGGYGALRLGAKYPERFASIWSHSGAFIRNVADLPQRGVDFTFSPELEVDADVFALTAQLAPRPERPVITLDCGTEDFLLDMNRTMHNHLTNVGIAHQYLEHPGTHDWDYWDLHVRAALAQHARVLGVLPGD